MVLWYGTIHKKITSELYVTLGVTKKKTAKIDMTALIREKKKRGKFSHKATLIYCMVLYGTIHKS